MDPFLIKRGDTAPSLACTLTVDGTAVDLTGASGVTFVMRERKADGTEGAVKVESAAVIVDAAAGEVQYDWAVGDLDTEGTFLAEFKVLEGGRTATYPSVGYITVVVGHALQE